MISLHRRSLIIFIKTYVAAALVVATVLSPLALSFVPGLLLVWHLLMWRWPINRVTNLLTVCFTYFALALLFTSPAGPFFSLLIALPQLLLINHSLEEAAESQTVNESRYQRRPTNICLTLLLIVLLVFGVSLLMSDITLLLSCLAIIIYFGILGTLVVRKLPTQPVAEIPVQQRMVAGTEAHLNIRLTNLTSVGGLLFLASPYGWLSLDPDRLSLKSEELVFRVSLVPPLAGPSIIRVKGWATDRWGLFQINFEIEPIQLYVIPRARYAAWLARRYLAATGSGSLPIISNIEALKPTYGLRRGVEYYGSQLYQPGDSLKNIDWKHSVMYNELISKEFTEFHGQSAVVLINLAVGDAEEADTLAYNIIVTAISLAQENIPAALAVYNQEDVVETTSLLQPQQLLAHSLRVAQEIATATSPAKYLNPPDVARLRANISRLRSVDSQPARALSRLLTVEYENLDDAARFNPATRALAEVFAKVDRQSNIVIISRRNHDAEALAFNTYSFTRRGNSVISV